MIQTNTLNFRLILEKKSGDLIECLGNYYLELTGETPFDLNKNFSEKFFCNSAGVPFYHIEDVARFSAEMAAFWKLKLASNPKLAITSLEELSDIWKKLATHLCASNSAVAKLAV
jgi:hypothetical protein